MSWHNRHNKESNIKTAFVIGLLVFVILSLILTYKAVPDRAPVKPVEYRETPEQRAWIEKRMRYHGLMGHFTVCRESARGWEFYRDADGKWCKL
jgi:hypothetical protein